MEYIIVQAGGKGTRLEHLTTNKPKALVPVHNQPMLFHLFRKYEDKKFIVIADYKKEVMKAYLKAFATVNYRIVEANGMGTCGGISQALDLVPDKQPFMLIWSDLILPESFRIPAEYEENEPQEDYIGISTTFPCRWSYENNHFEEKRSIEHGVAGCFWFTDKSKLSGIPDSGELVRWLQENGKTFGEVSLAGTKEFGILKEYNELEKEKCRPFNKVHVVGDCFVKEPIDEQGAILAKREIDWYEKAKERKIAAIPEIYETTPLVMEYLSGKNIYECDGTYEEKKEILSNLIHALGELHESEQVETDYSSMEEAYFEKTFQRLEKVWDLVPYAKESEIIINGRKCRNVFYYKEDLKRLLHGLKCEKFSFIHGDCTFSNIMLRENNEPVLIDPRGYFGHTKYYGDVRYDWAKLYYSIVGNYDRFNLKDFRLEILENEITISVESNHWEELEKDFFEMSGANPYEIKLIHAIIWLSLTTYAWQDYDSVCGAFYLGLYYLEELW